MGRNDARQSVRGLVENYAEWWYIGQRMQTDVRCTIFSVASAKYRDERPSDKVRTKQIRPFELAKSRSPSSTFWIAS